VVRPTVSTSRSKNSCIGPFLSRIFLGYRPDRGNPVRWSTKGSDKIPNKINNLDLDAASMISGFLNCDFHLGIIFDRIQNKGCLDLVCLTKEGLTHSVGWILSNPGPAARVNSSRSNSRVRRSRRPVPVQNRNRRCPRGRGDGLVSPRTGRRVPKAASSGWRCRRPGTGVGLWRRKQGFRSAVHSPDRDTQTVACCSSSLLAPLSPA
jgi:hypothetical protein